MYAKKITFTAIALLLGLALATSSYAGSQSKKKVSYTEDQFLSAFSGKSRKVVEEKLGKPAKKEQSVKPSGANAVLSQIRTKDGAEESNRVNVEMWYYENAVHYDPKHTYKKTELTFVNDRCMNITFFNK